ncbi:MAG: hypothetical protein ACRBF0_18715 [Calditrichia bacterium]
MKRFFFIKAIEVLVISACMFSCVPSPKVPLEETALSKKVLTFLHENYPVNKIIYNEELSFEDSTVYKIPSPFISKKLDYRFYKATLSTAYMEYMYLEIILAINQLHPDRIVVLKSPTFTDTNPEFLSLFQNTLSESELEKKNYTKEIVLLFKEITYEGKVEALDNSLNGVYSYELWHSDLSWRIFDFYFDENILIDIRIKGGVKRGKMLEGYERK